MATGEVTSDASSKGPKLRLNSTDEIVPTRKCDHDIWVYI